MVRVRVFVLGIAGAAFALGCGATTGSTWVMQPEPGPFVSDELEIAAEHPIEALDEPRTSRFASEVEPAPTGPRPRLSRTVTLGEVIASSPERGQAAPTGDRAPINVTVNNYMTPAPSYYDGYFGAPFVAGDFRPGNGVRPTPPMAPAPTRPGQDWPALPSYGPAFPFKTAPASPWAPAR